MDLIKWKNNIWPMIEYLGGKANKLAYYIILFYYLIKWKLINLLINYLINDQNLFLTRKYVS